MQRVRDWSGPGTVNQLPSIRVYISGSAQPRLPENCYLGFPRRWSPATSLSTVKERGCRKSPFPYKDHPRSYSGFTSPLSSVPSLGRALAPLRLFVIGIVCWFVVDFQCSGTVTDRIVPGVLPPPRRCSGFDILSALLRFFCFRFKLSPTSQSADGSR